MSLDTGLTISRFLSLAKTDEARLVGDSVVGRLAQKYLVVTNAALLAEQFANNPARPATILAFTKRYGPLKTDASAGQHFTVNFEEWCSWHKLFRERWRRTTPAQLSKEPGFETANYKAVGRRVHLGEESWLGFGAKGSEFVTKDLWTLIEVCQATISLERLRICANPDCEKPYFVARYPKEALCNAATCKEWNGRRLKLEYWNRHKGPILKERKRIREVLKDGTHKTG